MLNLSAESKSKFQILLQTRKNRGNRYGKIDLCIIEFRCEIPRENGIWLF